MGLGPGRGPNEAGGLSIPSKVKALPVPVAAVSCGGFFTMVLTEEGQLWNWGGTHVYFFPLNCVFVSSQYGPVSYQVEIFIISLILLNKSKGVMHLVSNKSSLFGLKSRITFVNRVLLQFKSSC